MSIRVLLVDDHDVVRDGVRYLLDAEPDIAISDSLSDGREAVRHAASTLPDVAIIDIAMPGLNGIETTRYLLDASPATEVLILSMHASPEYIFQAFQAGAQGYLLKESAGAEVVAAVRSVHAGRRYLSRKLAGSAIDHYLRERRGASPLESLSRREREVLQLVVEGSTSAEVAELLALSPKSVDTYRSRIMKKLGIGDLPGLVKFAIKHGLTSLE